MRLSLLHCLLFLHIFCNILNRLISFLCSFFNLFPRTFVCKCSTRCNCSCGNCHSRCSYSNFFSHWIFYEFFSGKGIALHFFPRCFLHGSPPFFSQILIVPQWRVGSPTLHFSHH